MARGSDYSCGVGSNRKSFPEQDDRMEQEGMTQAIGGQVAAERSPRSGESGSGGGDSGPAAGDSRKVQSHQLLTQVSDVASGVGVIFKGC